MAHRLSVAGWSNRALEIWVSSWASLSSHLVTALARHLIEELLESIQLHLLIRWLLLRIWTARIATASSIRIICRLIGQFTIILRLVVIGNDGRVTWSFLSGTFTSRGSSISATFANHGVASGSRSAEVTEGAHGSSGGPAILPSWSVLSIGLFGSWIDVAVSILTRLLKLMMLQVTRKSMDARSHRVSSGIFDRRAVAIWVHLLNRCDCALSLVVHIDEFLMNLTDLWLGNGEGLPISERLDGGQLVEKDEVIVEDVVVDSIEIRLKNLFIHLIETSLLKSHVHYAAENLKQIFDSIVHSLNRVSTLLITVLANWDIEFSAELLSGLLSLVRNHIEFIQNIVDIDFFNILGSWLLVSLNGITKLFVESSQVVWVLILVLNGYRLLWSLFLHHKVDILDLLWFKLVVEHADGISAQISLVSRSDGTVLSSPGLRALSFRSFLLGTLLRMQEAHVLAVKRWFARILGLSLGFVNIRSKIRVFMNLIKVCFQLVKRIQKLPVFLLFFVL